MIVRHLTAAANVDSDGHLIDPLAVRHGVIVAGLVADLAGAIDPRTHLNSDFEGHDLDQCVIAERLVVGAPVLPTETGLNFASAADGAYQPRGQVDLTGRRAAWLAVLASRRRTQ